MTLDPPSSSGMLQARETDVLVVSVTLGFCGFPGGAGNKNKSTTNLLKIAAKLKKSTVSPNKSPELWERGRLALFFVL